MYGLTGIPVFVTGLFFTVPNIFFILLNLSMMLSNNFVDPTKTNWFGEFNQKMLQDQQSS